MPRNAEVIRQWTILRAIEQSRAAGVTIDDLSRLCAVTTRTIRRDLQALEESGFPLFDDKSQDDGRTRWHINGQAFRGLAAGLTLSELCALYFSRTLLESLSGTPFRDDLESAFDKVGGALTPHMRRFLDRLPRILATKPEPMRRLEDPRVQQIVARLLEGTLQQREAILTYHSSSSQRTKAYRLHPYRLAYAGGGLYLIAFVPEYDQTRTFAVERIRDISLLDDRFELAEDLPETVFPDSLGVHSGEPQQVEIAFDASAAEFVRGREWHRSQEVVEDGDGVRLRLNVCLDRALTSWILSFGGAAKVIAPAQLGRSIADEHAQAAARYR